MKHLNTYENKRICNAHQNCNDWSWDKFDFYIYAINKRIQDQDSHTKFFILVSFLIFKYPYMSYPYISYGTVKHDHHLSSHVMLYQSISSQNHKNVYETLLPLIFVSLLTLMFLDLFLHFSTPNVFEKQLKTYNVHWPSLL